MAAWALLPVLYQAPDCTAGILGLSITEGAPWADNLPDPMGSETGPEGSQAVQGVLCCFCGEDVGRIVQRS